MASAKRLVCDPAIGIMDLQKVLNKQISRAGSRDITKMLLVPHNANWGWKTAPNVQWMSKCPEMFIDFLHIAPNGVLPGSKLRLALLKLNESKKMNFSKQLDGDWADQCDQRIRVLLSQFRSMKAKHACYVTAMRKATEEEKRAVDSVLEEMQLESGAQQEVGNHTLEANDGATSSSAALVPLVPPEAKAVGPKDVFKKILQKKDSSPLPMPKQALVALRGEAKPATMQSQHMGALAGMFVPPDGSSSELELEVAQPARKQKGKQAPKAAPYPEPKASASKARKNLPDLPGLPGLGEKGDQMLQMALKAEVPFHKHKKRRRKASPKKKASSCHQAKTQKEDKAEKGR